MVLSRARWVTLFATCCATISTAATTNAADPLFQSDAVLDVRIVMPLTTMLSERPIEYELPGTLELTDADAAVQMFDVQLRTRGHFRRNKDVCKFPPLRINFRTSQTRDTVFHKQDKLKLVTHCQRSPGYEQTVLQEYIAYRILNLLTDTSFRVRLLRITYVDSAGTTDTLTRYGFLIEHKSRLAHRLDNAVIDTPSTRIDSLMPGYTNLISLFHYLIGNTDFSPIMAAAGETCCHNHVLIGISDGPYRSVPYDFDQSGLVDPPHAITNPRFGLRNVRHRLYRGRCANNEQLQASIELFLEKRAEIDALLANDELLHAAPRRKMSAYIGAFYKTLQSPRKVASRIAGKCI